jgi:hypothetical protein
MTTLIVRRTIQILAAVLGAVFLIIGVATRFSPDAISTDMAAFIRVTGPVLIGLVLGAGLLEVAREARG